MMAIDFERAEIVKVANDMDTEAKNAQNRITQLEVQYKNWQEAFLHQTPCLLYQRWMNKTVASIDTSYNKRMNRVPRITSTE